MFETRLFAFLLGIGALLGTCYGLVKLLTCDVGWDEV